MKADDLIIPLSDACTVSTNASLGDAVLKLNKNRVGIIIVTANNSKELHSILTEGDIRRILTSGQHSFSQLMGDQIIKFSNKNPIYVSSQTPVRELILCMCKNKIWDIPIVESDRTLKGFVHMHDAVAAFTDLTACHEHF